MRVLIILSMLALANSQRPGYNYQPPERTVSREPFTGDIGQSQTGFNQPAENEFISPEPASPAEQDFNNGPALAEQTYQPAPELQKEFFTYTVDERDFQEPINYDQLSSSLRKNLRVIFIKGPEQNGVENAALALSRQAGEQQTAIYVLTKQADINDLANRLNNIRTTNNEKPLVHFVKYRTPQDALNAQRAIQSQYDQLGGVSTHQSGGVAPVLNFASNAPVKAPPAPQEPVNTYLPASVLRSRA